VPQVPSNGTVGSDDLTFDRKVVVFYSYKGGVGRTMAMCNVAAYLAASVSRSGDQRVRTLKEVERTLPVLCADFDIEAPGVPSYLRPPQSAQPVRGLLGLILECFQDTLPPEREAQVELIATRLRLMLRDRAGEFTYVPEESQDIVVLPAGELSDPERIQALELLSSILKPAQRQLNPGEARRAVPFFDAFYRVCRELYSYTLVDSRTGLAEIGFATTLVLADTLVLLFRPNITQLLAVQRVLGGFLFQRGLVSTSSNAPVIPVITPRPVHTAPDLIALRSLSVNEIFRWLRPSESDDDETRLANPIIELPFDNTLQVGERLLIEPRADATPEDPEAPLYKAYVALATAIKAGNAENDVDGARAFEAEKWQDGEFASAIQYGFMPVRHDAANRDHWDRLRRYVSPATNDPELQDRLVSFCEATLSDETQPDVASFYATMMLAAFDYQRRTQSPMATDPTANSRSRRGKFVSEMWFKAQALRDPLCFQRALETLAKVQREDKTKRFSTGEFPSEQVVQEILAARILSKGKDSQSLWEAALRLERAYKHTPIDVEKLYRALCDQVRVAPDDASRALALRDLSHTYIRNLDFENGVLLGLEAAQFSDARPEVVIWGTVIVRRLCSDGRLKTLHLSRAFEELSRPRDIMLAPDSELAALLSEVGPLTRNQETSEDVFIAMALRLMSSDLLAPAKEILTEISNRERAGVSIFALLELVAWLETGKEISTFGEQLAQSRLWRSGPPMESIATVIVLAASPSALSSAAAIKLQSDEWPLRRFELSLFAVGDNSSDNIVEYIDTTLRRWPHVASFLSSAPVFRLIKLVLERHISRETEHMAVAKRIMENMSMIAETAMSANAFTGRIEMLLGKSIKPESLSQIHAHWTKNLSHLTSDVSWGFLAASILGYGTADTTSPH
jgi:hypothetical protein